MNILLCTHAMEDARRVIAAELSEHRCTACAPGDLAAHLSDVDVVVPFAATVGAQEIAAGRFGLVQQFGVGLDKVDVSAAAAAGVWVANVPGALYGNADSVAEHAIMMMLALARRLNYAAGDIAAGRISEPPGRSLLRKTCCLVGLGDIGVEIARRLLPFGMRLTAARRQPRQPVYADLRIDRVVALDALTEIVGDADFVVLMLPLTPETRHIASRQVLAAMKPGAYLVNVGRGDLIDPDALLDALASGHLAGAGLDVFWQEPVPADHPIFGYNVIATPHVAGVTDSSVAGIALTIADNVARYAQGSPPLHAANRVDGPARRREG